MYIWQLQKALSGTSVNAVLQKAAACHVSSLWVKIGDGTQPYANIRDGLRQQFLELVAGAGQRNITVLGYHVPHCADLDAAQREVDFVAGTLQNFGLKGVVIDNEDGPQFFVGGSVEADAYGAGLRQELHRQSLSIIMSSNDVPSLHRKAFAEVIGMYIDINAPQTYYGRSPSVQARIDRAITANAAIKAPIFPIGAAFISDAGAGDGGCSSPEDCARRARQFIQLMSDKHAADPDRFPGYGFWNWQECPPEVWAVLGQLDAFVAPSVSGGAASVRGAARSQAVRPSRKALARRGADERRSPLPGSEKKLAAGSRIVGAVDPTRPMRVLVVLSRKSEILKAELYTRAALPLHQRSTITHADYAMRFGATEEAIAAVRAFAERSDLKVLVTNAESRTVELEGTAGAVMRAFETELAIYETSDPTGVRYRGREGTLNVPESLLPHVVAILGVDDRPAEPPTRRLYARRALADNGALAGGFDPSEIARLYDFPVGTGAGQRIALIELGGNYDPADLATYFADRGIAQEPTVRAVVVGGYQRTGYGTSADDGEVMLDIEVAGAMAPGAEIVLYFAQNSDRGFYQATSEALHDPATSVISISWGSPEKRWTEQSRNIWDQLGQTAMLLDVPIFVASGDDGAGDEQQGDPAAVGGRNVDFPASVPHGIIAVGGTRIETDGTRIVSESVWNSHRGATGGGVSKIFPVPPWQAGLSSSDGVGLTGRGMPDVASLADPDTGFAIKVNGSDFSDGGGTSASAPQWAALAAVIGGRLGRKLGFFLPQLYAAAGATNDIVVGDNSWAGVSGYDARTGWDACTGLGSPIGRRLEAVLSTVPPVPLSAPAIAAAAPPPDLLHEARMGASARTPDPDTPQMAFAGALVHLAYDAYDNNPGNATPPIDGLRQELSFAAWVQMRDFDLFGRTTPTFYGFVAEYRKRPGTFVMALRGTRGGTEWFDDATAVFPVPFNDYNCGSVGAGFLEIYKTLQLIEAPPSGMPIAAAPHKLGHLGGIVEQVADLVERRTAAGAGGVAAAAAPALKSILVTGHSLGSALATLYAMENAQTHRIANLSLCIFASPQVGDAIFATAFDRFGLPSLNVINTPDLVPTLPIGFAQVGRKVSIDSTSIVRSGPGCAHAIATYRHLFDNSVELDTNCAIEAQAAAGRALAGTHVAVPAAAPGAREDAQPAPAPGALPLSIDALKKIARNSLVARYPWKGRGRAPTAYLDGMAVCFADFYCRLGAGEATATAAAAPVVGGYELDALFWYRDQFDDARLDGLDTAEGRLRLLFVLMIGLGMRETSGQYCVGRDTDVKDGSNKQHDTAEAGLFQMSYNITYRRPQLQAVVTKFTAPGAVCRFDLFSPGASCAAEDAITWGNPDEPGYAFQRRMKACPAFAVELAALAMRSRRDHWGPLTRRQAEVLGITDAMLRAIEAAIDAASAVAPGARSSPPAFAAPRVVAAAGAAHWMQPIDQRTILPFNRGLNSASANTMSSILGTPVLPLTKECQNGHASTLVKQNLKREKITSLFDLEGLAPAIADVKAILYKAFAANPDLESVLGTEGMLCVRHRKPTGGRPNMLPSNHSWGTAVDFKITGYEAPGDTGRTVPRFIAMLIPLFNAAGWYSGVAFHDSMHFEVSEEKIRRWAADGTLTSGAVAAA
jgi:kumamolisin